MMIDGALDEMADRQQSCTHLYTHVYTHVDAHVHTHVCAHVDAHVDAHAHAHVYTHVVARPQFCSIPPLHSCVRARMHVRARASSLVGVCMRMHAYMCMRAQVGAQVCAMRHTLV